MRDAGWAGVKAEDRARACACRELIFELGHAGRRHHGNHRQKGTVKLGKGSGAAEQGGAGQGRAGQTWEEECAAREAGAPVRQDQGKGSWEVQVVVAWTSRRAVGAAKGLDGGVLGAAWGVRVQRKWVQPWGVLSLNNRASLNEMEN